VILAACVWSFSFFTFSLERLSNRRLGKIDTERVHVQSVEKTGKRFTKSSEALVHELEVHHVGFQVYHGIRQLSKRRLEAIEWEVIVS